MDEVKGRQVARTMGLYIMGTIGVLLYAFEKKVITGSDVEDALDRMKKANRHIGEDLINYSLSKIK